MGTLGAHRVNHPDIPYVLRRGWRQSMRGALYRRINGWVAIVKPAGEEYRLSLFRTGRTVEDVMAIANEAIKENDSTDRISHAPVRWEATA